MNDIHDLIYVQENYVLTYENGVYSLLEKEFKKKLDDFTEQHLQIQKAQNYVALPDSLVADFPFIEYTPYKDEIFSRKQDINLLHKILSSHGDMVLEVGGWNGWLSKWLTASGLNVLSTDIFKDEQNGLGAKVHHKNSNWVSLQFDLSEPQVIKKKFDFVIFNHCLQFLPHPHQLISKYKACLKQGGVIIVLGLNFHKNVEKEENRIREYRKKYVDNYNFKIHFYPCEGFFDYSDFERLRENGFRFMSYNLSLPGRIRNVFRGKKSGIMILDK